MNAPTFVYLCSSKRRNKMSRKLFVLMLIIATLILTTSVFAQDDPPISTGSAEESNSEVATAAEPGQSVSCTTNVIQQPWIKMHLSGWKSGNTISGVSWSVVDSKGAWSINGNAYGHSSQPKMRWSGNWWWWWGPFQINNHGTTHWCNF